MPHDSHIFWEMPHCVVQCGTDGCNEGCFRPCTGNGELGHGGFSWGTGSPCAWFSLCLDRNAWHRGVAHFHRHTFIVSRISRKWSVFHRFFRNDPLFSLLLMVIFLMVQSTSLPDHPIPPDDRRIAGHTTLQSTPLSFPPFNFHAMACFERWAFLPRVH